MRYIIETERADLFDVNIIITMKILLEKEVPFDKLNEAFQKACKVHEVLNSKVVIEPSGKAFYIDNAAPQNSFAKTDLSLCDLINDNEKKRFRIENGEFIRGFLSPEGIVFMMHHLGGDGKSVVYFIETFMKCLSGMECALVPFRNLTLDNMPEQSKLPLLYNLLIKSWNRKWQKAKHTFSFMDMDNAYTEFWKKNKTKVEIKRYEKDDLKLLLDSAKNAGVSLTAYIITDLIKDMDYKADVGLAVDGRTDKNRSMGNQATGISIQYKYNSGLSFEDNARIVHNLMKKKLSNDKYRYFVLQFMGKLDPSLADSLNLERAGSFSSKVSSKVAEIMGYGKKVKDLSITNLTRADIPLEYGEYKIKEMIFVPPVISYGKNIIGIVTAGDVMNLAIHKYAE